MELYSNMTNYMYDNAGILTYLLPCFLGYSHVIVLLLTRDMHLPNLPFKEHCPVKFPNILSKDLLEFVPWVHCPYDIHVLIYRTNDCISYQWTETDMRQCKAKL